MLFLTDFILPDGYGQSQQQSYNYGGQDSSG